MNNLVRQAIELLEKSDSLFVLTGAGVSAESGVPTFRGADGLWKNYSAQELATPHAFRDNPALVWEWYHWRQALILKAEPNPAHCAFTELESIFKRFLMLTQNVDNIHRRAGSKKVLELHGNIFRTRCCECGNILEHLPGGEELDDLPRCACGGLLRPDVVWFGEAIPEDIWREALDFLKEAGVAMICGTSSVVWPAAAIPEFAREKGVKTVEINPEPTPISSIVDVSIRAKAGEVLPVLVHELGAKQKR
jgi:NAD-dependent deacetylase